MTRTSPFLFLFAFLCASCASDSVPETTTITMIGTNDVHGQLLPQGERAGLISISAYVNAVREAREADGGHVLLIDAGDMWQGTLESNLTEGASVVAAFNALGYDAVAVGNHEFDFGPVGPSSIPTSPDDDKRGALKARALEANHPFLSANLAYKDTGERVQWDNVHPTTMIEFGELKVGIIGIITARALSGTIAANVDDLIVLPLVPAIVDEAAALRDAGANLVVVTAHAGGHCEVFTDPNDLSSCLNDSEIFRVARDLPQGTVDHIFAGHVHQGVAHIVNGISISSAWSSTRAFSRVDFIMNNADGSIVERIVSPPHDGAPIPEYEGRDLVPMESVRQVAEDARAEASAQKHQALGVTLAGPFTRDGNPESTLGNLFTQALLAEVDADVALHNVQGGLRADLAAGPLTFGEVYEISPFENRVVVLELSGAELRSVIADQAHRGRRRVGFAGMRVSIDCSTDDMRVDMVMDSGPILDSDSLRVIVNDYMALGGDNVLRTILPDGGFPIDTQQPMTRDVFVDWIVRTGGTLDPDDYRSDNSRNWNGSFPISPSCMLVY